MVTVSFRLIRERCRSQIASDSEEGGWGLTARASGFFGSCFTRETRAEKTGCSRMLEGDGLVEKVQNTRVKDIRT